MSNTDTSTKEGSVVGLIDALISISRTLCTKYSKELSTSYNSYPAIYEALKDFHEDEHVNRLLKTGPHNPRIHSEEDTKLMEVIRVAGEELRKQNIIP